jgi:hypothetical protein
LDAKVPEEYLTNATIRDKLPNIKLNKLHEDVLFYLFYNCPGEVYQVAAASELLVQFKKLINLIIYINFVLIQVRTGLAVSQSRKILASKGTILGTTSGNWRHLRAVSIQRFRSNPMAEGSKRNGAGVQGFGGKTKRPRHKSTCSTTSTIHILSRLCHCCRRCCWTTYATHRHYWNATTKIGAQ